MLVINPDTSPHEVALPLRLLPLAGDGTNITSAALSIRDLWAHAALPVVAKGSAVVKFTVPPLDSVFLTLTPS